ncbi:hypothetical protein KR018_001633, partial [Drosophila ironensis]
NGTITRGCWASTEETKCEAPSCNACNSDKCNTNLVCYNCTTCNTVTDSNLLWCPLNDKCFTYGTDATNMVRGCTSNTTNASCANTNVNSNTNKCLTCDSGKCNNLPYEKEAVSCFQCDGSSEDCTGLQAENTNKTCNVAYYQDSGCFTYVNGDKINRGCVNAFTGNCSETAGCSECTTDACNGENQSFKCYACISSVDSKCWEGSSTEIATVECPAKKCFSGYWNRQMVRQCFTGASELMQYQCNNKVEGHQCTVCEESLCNTKAYSGASGLSQVGVLGLLIAAFVSHRSS